MKKNKALKEKIKKNEGFRNFAYLDQLGHLTIGYGHLIKPNEKKLLTQKHNKKTLTKIFELDFKKALNDYQKNYSKEKFNQKIKDTIIEMIFQLGIKKQKKFKKVNNYFKNNQIYMASLEMKNSLWYKQTPERVDRLIKFLIK